jgi:aspartate aminotransferase
MGAHRLSTITERLLEQEAALIRFFSDSAWARRDPADPEVADLVVGNPHEMALPAFVEAIQRWAVPRDPAWYAYKFNEPYAQEAAAAGLRDRRGIPFEPQDVFLTDGAFTGLNLCIRIVADPGDEVVFLSPPWFFYAALIVAQGVTPVRALVDRTTWDPDPEALGAAITERTRAVIVNSPNNPTGRIYPPETLQRLAATLTAASERIGRPIYLISDEAYSRIVFDDREFRSPTELYPHSFLVYTYGKQLLTPGQRLGYVALPPTMPDRGPIRDALQLAQISLGGNGVPNAVMQRALADLDGLSVDVKALQRRRDRLTEVLRSSGYELPHTEGTFYLFPTSPIPDDLAFVDRLSRDKVFVLPGSLVESPGRFRISVTGNDDMVERAIPVFQAAARELR